MDPAPSDPDWSRLPHRPVEFFGLQSGFNRQDLKRAYNRLLKQFKPEKFPQEFQRIREAYEGLDGHLRYGEQAQDVGGLLERGGWELPPILGGAIPVEPAEAGPTPAVPRDEKGKSHTDDNEHLQRPAFLERLSLESPEKLFLELEQFSEKQPWHYYALAVLSDTLPDRDPLGFVNWLLNGLRAFPRDGSLYRLLWAELRAPQPREMLSKLLPGVAEVVRDQRYYALTEVLWDRALQQLDFREVRRLLQDCESRMRDFRIAGRMTFLVHFLKGAMWRANSAWTESQFQFLQEHHQEIPAGLDQDVEFLFHLREYLRFRQEFREAHPLRCLLDDTIHKHCTGTPVEAEQAWLLCQVRVATSTEELLEAFPPGEDAEAAQAFAIIWHFVRAEHGERPVPHEFQQDAVRVLEMLREADDQASRSWPGRSWSWMAQMIRAGRFGIYAIIFLVMFLMTLFPMGVFASAQSEFRPGLFWFLFLLTFFSTLFGGWAINKYVVDPAWNKRSWRFSLQCYEQLWRRELLLFQSRTLMPSWRMVALIEAIARSPSTTQFDEWILTHARRDVALLVHSAALDSLA